MGPDRLKHFRRRSWAAAGVALALCSLSLTAGAALDPAHLETWKLPKASLYAVAASGQNAWACGYWGTILRSTDAGKTWTQPDTPTAKTLFGISFADDQNGLGGRRGRHDPALDRRRRDLDDAAGRRSPTRWASSRPLDVNLFGVAAISPTAAWAVGDLGIVLRTRDGETWEKVTFDAGDLRATRTYRTAC